MLTVIRDDYGNLQAACEWWLVDDLGRQDWLSGRYVWVEQLEVSERVHFVNIMKTLSLQIALFVPRAVGAYWVRRDRNPMKLYAFRRNQLVKEVRV